MRATADGPRRALPPRAAARQAARAGRRRALASVPGRCKYEKTCTCVSGEASTSSTSAAASPSVSPGKPTMTSERDDGAASARECAHRRVVVERIGRRVALSISSDACCSGRWRWGTGAATLHEIDGIRAAVHRLERAQSEQRVGRPGGEQPGERHQRAAVAESRPYEPRCTPVSAVRGRPQKVHVQRGADLASGFERPAPRVLGMMRSLQRSSQPVCTRSVNAVRPPRRAPARRRIVTGPNRCHRQAEGIGELRRPRFLPRLTTRATFDSDATPPGSRMA